MTKKDIAIIGGAFDPVHNGHTNIARFLSKNYIVDEIWLLPSYNPPLKDINSICSFNHRVNMLNLAIEDIKHTYVNTIEETFYYDKLGDETINNNLNSDIKTYTDEILSYIKEKYSNLRIHFICGFDSIKNIKLWHNYKELIKNYWFYIFDREDKEFKTIEQKKYYLNNLGKKDNINFYYEFFNENIPAISSTEIRNLLKDKKNNQDEILKFIDIKVYNYIIKNDLYK